MKEEAIKRGINRLLYIIEEVIPNVKTRGFKNSGSPYPENKNCGENNLNKIKKKKKAALSEFSVAQTQLVLPPFILPLA